MARVMDERLLDTLQRAPACKWTYIRVAVKSSEALPKMHIAVSPLRSIE